MPEWKTKLVYHMTEEPNWRLIRRHGLLSTSCLLDSCGLAGAERFALEQCQRTKPERLPNGAIIRDQLPMPPAALARCLSGALTPEDWYLELNRRVFFWIDGERLERQCRACRSPQIVLTVDARELLARYGTSSALTPFNTGNARRKPARRGRETFVPYRSWQQSGWATEAAEAGVSVRSSSHAPVELAVTGAVADIVDFTIAVRRLLPGDDF